LRTALTVTADVVAVVLVVPVVVVVPVVPVVPVLLMPGQLSAA
jgi:hypothetical protein